MKKKRTDYSGFFNLRVLLAFLIGGAATCSVLSGALLGFLRPNELSKSPERTLTFPQRVAYQRAIEEVYWRHRIWPAANASPKPPLEKVMSQAQIEKKVAAYLRKSQALVDYWQRPITSDQLQAEMDRIAQRTKQPEVLHELFAALGNDPFVIAECIARPVLAEQKLLGLATRKGAPQVPPRRAANPLRISASRYRLPNVSGRPGGCIDDAWTATAILGAPGSRELHTAVWTGGEMIVWGGLSGISENTGARYIPATDSWITTSTTNAPAGRFAHTAVWTGKEMIVWGGFGDNPNGLNTGGKYNPATDSWIATTTDNAPTPRLYHTAVWTGSEMIVWGGFNNINEFNTGGRYNPTTDAWTATNTSNAPSARVGHTAVWTGSEMIVWGATGDSTGGRYDPSTDSWTATSTTNAPSARGDHTAVWSGNEMIIWGGISQSSTRFNTGGRYDPSTDSWVATSTSNAPDARYNHTAVWTGSEMIVWGGYDGTTYLNTGGKYNPGTDSWTVTNTTNTPEGRRYHTAIWTGAEMVVWGGGGAVGLENTGARYCVLYGPTPTPTASPTPTATGTPPLVYQAWADRYNGPGNGYDRAVAIAVDNKGNVYVAGTSPGGPGFSLSDYATIKYNAAGQQEWVARYNGPGNDNDSANAMTIDGAGNVYVTGVSGNGCAPSDVATVKYNSAGQEQWVARRDGAGQAIAVDAAGNVYVTGVDTLGWVTIKYSWTGVEQWVAHHNSGTPAAIAVDKTGNVYVTGEVPRAGYDDYATIKYDASGVQQWLATYSGPGDDGSDEAKAIALDQSGNVYVTGFSFVFGTGDDYATIKYDPSGQQQWVARYDRGNSGDVARAIAVDASANVYVTGASSGPNGTNYATVKYNSAGQQQWVALYDGPNHGDSADAIALDNFGNVYVTGSSTGDYSDYLTVKYDSAGQQQWVERYDGPSGGGDVANAIAVDTSGSVYVTGYSYSSETSDDYATIKYGQYGQGPTPTPTPSATASPTPTSTATPTATPTASPTPTATCTPVATATPQPTPCPTFTATPMMTQTPTPTPTITATPTATPTVSPSATPTGTPTTTATANPTPTARPTPTPRPKVTPRTRPTPPPRA